MDKLCFFLHFIPVNPDPDTRIQMNPDPHHWVIDLRLKNNLTPLYPVLLLYAIYVFYAYKNFLYRFGYQIVSKPVQNTVVIDLSSKNNLTASTCLDESQTTLKVRPIQRLLII